MTHRRIGSLVTVGVASAALLGLVIPVAGQAPARGVSTKAAGAAKGGKAYKAPRTVDGQPDLQGVWNFATATPLERPDEFADKQVLSDEEAAEYAQKDAAKFLNNLTKPADGVGNYNEFWYDGNKRVIDSKRTSLITDPADGRIPALTPTARQRVDAIAASRKGIGTHEPTPGGWVEELGPGGLQVRCIMGFNSGPPMTPAAYNQNVQLFQSPGYVVILNEMIHNARIVPLDGRPHGAIPQWAGDSRGHWEGETLVVETKNFLRETAFNNGRTTTKLRLIERFTRVDADTLSYEFTVEDPNTWTRPWTVEMPMSKSDQPMYEYACHEGNYGLTGILAGAREREKAAEETRKQD